MSGVIAGLAGFGVGMIMGGIVFAMGVTYGRRSR
jgi:hypothetical protein